MSASFRQTQASGSKDCEITCAFAVGKKFCWRDDSFLQRTLVSISLPCLLLVYDIISSNRIWVRSLDRDENLPVIRQSGLCVCKGFKRVLTSDAEFG